MGHRIDEFVYSVIDSALEPLPPILCCCLNCGKFYKTFWGIINAAIGILAKVLAQVTPLGVLIVLKKFYEIDTCGQFHEAFLA
jgi:hypothetical protein